jgi:hypothetical protein|eukprot:5534253-Prymnesium_polylepis.3
MDGCAGTWSFGWRSTPYHIDYNQPLVGGLSMNATPLRRIVNTSNCDGEVQRSSEALHIAAVVSAFFSSLYKIPPLTSRVYTHLKHAEKFQHSSSWPQLISSEA